MSDSLEDPNLVRPSWETTPDETDVASGGAGSHQYGRGRHTVCSVMPNILGLGSMLWSAR
jgi:hypothetical protein